MTSLKRLYDNHDNHMPVAMDVIEEINFAMAPIFNKWYNLGYSIRDLALAMQTGVHEATTMKLMETAADRKKNYVIKFQVTKSENFFNIDDDLLSKLQLASTGNNKINAIKELRMASKAKDGVTEQLLQVELGLKEAKDMVEILSYEGYIDAGSGVPNPTEGTRIVDTYKITPSFQRGR